MRATTRNSSKKLLLEGDKSPSKDEDVKIYWFPSLAHNFGGFGRNFDYRGTIKKEYSDLSSKTLDLFQKTWEIFRKTLDIFSKTLDFFKKNSNVFQKISNVFWKISHVFAARSEVGRYCPKKCVSSSESYLVEWWEIRTFVANSLK